ncbi:amidase [Frigidibacter sp. ROC022]|uniref:amidase n=1 Tax=Frigidibacter sp. ROC022 TaxID=2971796 RepID=UPI00215B060D|nr:amidase [Frigidibacter sp. ROC022]MCR8725506.1 amidase [Frigidibacter sp. ROC022]
MGPFPGIADLGARYRDGSLTPSEAVEEALARIEALEPSLNAFALPMAEAARAEAARRDAELRAGRDLGPLHGIPVVIKDLIEVEGVPTGYGSKVRPPQVAPRDAELVARLRAAGAVILGKTNLLEYAYGIAHPEIGQTNNPHDPTRTAGGSSGGSAAAVASGIAALGIGTDTGGSIRIPAAYCGVVGVKPSFGLVPLDGVFPLSWSLDHAGPLVRSVADAAIALECLADRPMRLASLRLSDLRIGVLRRHVSGTEIGRPVTERFSQVVAQLRGAGARVDEIDVEGLDRANETLVTILLPEASVIHEELIALNPDGYAPKTRAQILAGREVPATACVAARRFQDELRDRVEAAFETVDVMISPSVPFVAPEEDPEIADGEDSEMLASGFANLTGHPSLSLPCGMADGLPVGMQLTGRLGGDARLLSAAAAIEAELGRDMGAKAG